MMAKDISESLGKMPPQAIDLEEAIIGSILLSEKSLLDVIDLLKPFHFYTDQHKEIYSVALDLHRESLPIDMRTVVNRLRKNGKLEIVGGAYYIAELTSKVSSAANIEYHARIIIEMAIKRELIQIASKIHHDAYEDTSDVFELLDRARLAIQYAEDFSVKSKHKHKEYIASHSFNALIEPEEEDTILYLQDIPIGSKENIITITGRSKSRKTVAASAIATAIFSGSHLGFSSDLPFDAPILHIDTEQGYKHYYHSVKRIFDDANLQVPHRFTSIHTRDADIPLRLELLQHLVSTLCPAVLIIDGVTDLVYDINSQEESTKIGELFLRLSSTYKMLIIAVIHTTKTTGFMTGAIGTILEKKSETVIKVELDENDSMSSHITCQFSRNKPFKDFTITADDNNKYSITDESKIQTKDVRLPGAYSKEQHEAILIQIFHLKEMIDFNFFKKRLGLCSKPIFSHEISGNKAKSFLDYYLKQVMLIENGDGMYILPVFKMLNNQLKLEGSSSDDMPF